VFEALDLSTSAYAAAAGGVFLGTVVQRLSGQAYGLIAAPILALAAPQYLPAALLFLGVFVGLTSAALETKHLSRHELLPGMTGRALGAVFGAIIAGWALEAELIRLAVAGVVFLGIALSLVGLRITIRPASLFTAGTIAGIMGTLTGIGAPPMALLYQHEETRRAAAMQNAFFFWGMSVSILTLTVAGLVGWRHILFAAFLAPAAILGLLVAQRLTGHFAKRRIRPFALVLAGSAATVLLLRSLF
jgi:uncharacterized membrane protein YfcA